MLQAIDLYKSFGGKTPALGGVSFSLAAGEFAVIIGSNGSGKSTLLKTLSGQQVADAGQVLISGREVLTFSVRERARAIARVSQEVSAGTAAELSIEENMTLAFLRGKRRGLCGYSRRRRAFFQERLSTLEMGLEGRMEQAVGTLSGGQRQALALVMATLASPPLLLLDEHCSALDPKSAAQVMALTSRLARELSITTLMVTHNLAHALAYGDRLLMVSKGQLVLDCSRERKKLLTLQELSGLFEGETLVGGEEV